MRERAKTFLKWKMKEWNMECHSSVPSDGYEPEGYRGIVIGKYVFITTYRISIALTEVYDCITEELVMQYEEEYEHTTESAYAELEEVPLWYAREIKYDYIVEV